MPLSEKLCMEILFLLSIALASMSANAQDAISVTCDNPPTVDSSACLYLALTGFHETRTCIINKNANAKDNCSSTSDAKYFTCSLQTDNCLKPSHSGRSKHAKSKKVHGHKGLSEEPKPVHDDPRDAYKHEQNSEKSVTSCPAGYKLTVLNSAIRGLNLPYHICVKKFVAETKAASSVKKVEPSGWKPVHHDGVTDLMKEEATIAQ